MLDLLCSQPQRLEPGLVILDRNVPLAEDVSIDVLAHDAAGLPVALLSCGPDLAQAIGRTAAVLAAFHRGRYLIDRLYCHAGMDAHRRPRFVLIGRRFEASCAADLLQLVGGCEIAVIESQVVRTLDGRPELHLVLLARSPTGTSDTASADAADRVVEPAEAPELLAPTLGARTATESAAANRDRKPPADERPTLRPLPVAPLPVALSEVQADVGLLRQEPADSEPGVAASAPSDEQMVGLDDDSKGATDAWSGPVLDDVDLLVRAEASPECRRLCLDARDSIRSLSSLVTQTIEPDRMCFLVEDVPLATLIPRGDSLQLRVGEEGGPAFEVRDDKGFNAGLNATFSHYFSRFAVRA